GTHVEDGGSGSDRTLPVLLVATGIAAGQTPIRSYVARSPALARDATGQPVFSLTLVLSRQPRADETTIHALITQSVMALDVTLTPSRAVVEHLPQAIRDGCQPLFAREAVFVLEVARDGAPAVLAQNKANGTQVRAALSTPLNRDDTLAVLAALDGAPTS